MVAALNIRTEDPHSPQRYIDLVDDLFDLKQPVRTYGDQHLTITRVEGADLQEMSVEGLFGKFLNLDHSQPWFDQTKFDKADADEIKNLNIPDHLQPNFRAFHFKLFCNSHTIVFEKIGFQFGVSPKQVLYLIKSLVNNKNIIDKYGFVEVSLIQTKESLENILSLAKLKTLDIKYSAPNPDDHGEFDKIMQERLKTQHARSIDVRLVADSSGSIEPDEETKALAKSALSNGSLVATGYDSDGKFVELRSSDHPKLAAEKYDPDLIIEKRAFLNAAAKIFGITLADSVKESDDQKGTRT